MNIQVLAKCDRCCKSYHWEGPTHYKTYVYQLLTEALGFMRQQNQYICPACQNKWLKLKEEQEKAQLEFLRGAKPDRP